MTKPGLRLGRIGSSGNAARGVEVRSKLVRRVEFVCPRCGVDRAGTVVEGGDGQSPVDSEVAPISRFSADGNWVLFGSYASDLAAGQFDPNPTADLFLYEVATAQITLASRAVGTTAVAANSPSFDGRISGDGRFIVFRSAATNLATVPPGPFLYGTWLHDRITGETRLVSHSYTGSNAAVYDGAASAISADGRSVLWSTTATNVVAGVVDTNQAYDVYVYDRTRDASTLVSHRAGAPLVAANGESLPQGISDDGRTVALLSKATDMAPNVADGNAEVDAFLVRNRDDLFVDGFEG
jgi:hypothetical protein